MLNSIQSITYEGEIGILSCKCGRFRENSYIISWPGKDHIVVDPGEGFYDYYVDHVSDIGMLKGIFLTHAHFDHVGSAGRLSNASGVPVTLHINDRRLLEKAPLYSLMVDKRRIELPKRVEFFQTGGAVEIAGGCRMMIIDTPGHTKGSVCLVVEKLAFTGDTLFYKAVGPTNYLESDYNGLISSVDKLLSNLVDGLCILPGHGKPWESRAAKIWWSENREDPYQFDIS